MGVAILETEKSRAFFKVTGYQVPKLKHRLTVPLIRSPVTEFPLVHAIQSFVHGLQAMRRLRKYLNINFPSLRDPLLVYSGRRSPLVYTGGRWRRLLRQPEGSHSACSGARTESLEPLFEYTKVKFSLKPILLQKPKFKT